MKFFWGTAAINLIVCGLICFFLAGWELTRYVPILGVWMIVTGLLAGKRTDK